MSETQQRRGPEQTITPAVPQHRAEAPPEVTGWVGWIVFASVMMLMVGSFQVIAGLTALFKDEYYVVSDRLVVSVDYTTWGWVHIGLGVVAVAAAFGLLRGQMWGRVLGIGVAGLSAITNLAFTAAFPVLALLMIALDVVVIYAIAVHGRELKD